MCISYPISKESSHRSMIRYDSLRLFLSETFIEKISTLQNFKENVLLQALLHKFKISSPFSTVNNVSIYLEKLVVEA